MNVNGNVKIFGKFEQGGSGTTASGQSSHAEGYDTTAIGNGSHAEGRLSTSIGSFSHSEGNLNIAIGNSSHVEGEGNIASGNNSHAEGVSTIAVGYASHVEGYNTTAIGDYSHASGLNTQAIGDASYVINANNISGVDSPQQSSDINEAYTLDTAANPPFSLIILNGDVTAAWNSYIINNGGFVTLTLYGGTGATETIDIYNVFYDLNSYGDITFLLDSQVSGVTDTTNNQFSATVITQLAKLTSNTFAGGNFATATGNVSFIHSQDSDVSGDNSAILGGVGNDLTGGGSVILGGSSNSLSGAYSAILGGQNITGIADNMVYVSNLNINNSPNIDNNLTQVLVRDNVSGDILYRDASTFGSSISIGFKYVFVDSTYGNDSTGVKYDLTKPYQTLAAALSVSTSGDIIFLRPGNYGTLTLKDGVNVYAMYGSDVRNITDNSLTVNCKIYGQMNVGVYSNMNSVISLTGPNSNLYLECNNIESAGVVIHQNPGDNVNNLNIVCNNVTFKLINYGFDINGGANFNLDIKNDYKILPNTTTVPIYIRGGYFGTTNIKINNVKIESGTHPYSGSLLWTEDTNLVNGNVKIKCKNVYSLINIQCSSFWGIIGDGLLNFTGLGNYDIELTNTTINSRSLISSFPFGAGTGPNVKLKTNTTSLGNGFNPETLVRNTSLGYLQINDSVIIKGSGSTDGNNVVIIGNPSGNTISGGYSNNLKTEFNNTKIIKISNGVSNKSIVAIDGLSGTTIFKNCEIIGLGNIQNTTNAFYADTLQEGDIYFRGCVSNYDNSTNINDTSVVSGFIYDPYITTFKF